MSSDRPPEKVTRLGKAIGYAMSAGFMLVLYIPIFWAVSSLVGIVGFLGVKLLEPTDDQFASALLWVRAASIAGGLYACWVLHVILRSRRASHAA